MGGALVDTAFRTLGWYGRHLVVGFAGGQIGNLTIAKGASLVGVGLRHFREEEPDAEQRLLQDVAKLHRDDHIAPRKARKFSDGPPRRGLRDGSGSQYARASIAAAMTVRRPCLARSREATSDDLHAQLRPSGDAACDPIDQTTVPTAFDVDRVVSPGRNSEAYDHLVICSATFQRFWFSFAFGSG